MGLTGRTLKVAVAVVLVLGVVVGIAVFLFQGPSVGVEDVGDWGEVTDERTEVVTTLWVKNPNPLGLSPNGSVRASYDLTLNRVALAEGRTRGIEAPPGNGTVVLSTDIFNDRLPAWWVNFVRNDETIPVTAEPRATVEAGPFTASPALPTTNRTLLSESTPVRSALSGVASRAEGNYTRTVSADRAGSLVEGSLVDDTGVDGVTGDGVTVGYEVRRGWATWGTVSENRTVVNFHFRVHNPSETVAVPAEPENLRASVDMNDVDLFDARGDDATLANPENFSTREGIDGRVIAPGETKEVVYAVEMDNERVDEWFTSHVRRGERTAVRVEFSLAFGVGETTFRVPEESRLAYTCELRTAILVDDKETATTCGERGSVPGGGAVGTPGATPTATAGTATPTAVPGGVSTPTATLPVTTQTDVPTDAPTATLPVTTPGTATPADEGPTARASANRTEGEAPLTVSFDGSESTDPDGDIASYVWRFDDGAPPGEGETTTHTFLTAGEYDVELVVIDEAGNRDSTTVTVTVESAVG